MTSCCITKPTPFKAITKTSAKILANSPNTVAKPPALSSVIKSEKAEVTSTKAEVRPASPISLATNPAWSFAFDNAPDSVCSLASIAPSNLVLPIFKRNSEIFSLVFFMVVS